MMQQECIPVGCVPSAAVASLQGGSASVHAGIPMPPGPGTSREQTPPGLGTPPQSRHPLPRDQTPPEPGTPWEQAPPLCGQTDACENITFATSLRTVINYVT